MLLASVGVDSTLRAASPGHRLNVVYPQEGVQGTGRRYPASALSADLRHVSLKHNGDDRVTVERRILNKGLDARQDVAERMYSKYAPEMDEIYRYDTITSIEVLDKVETTYTMSVDDPLHQFVADGVIHKNTAAEVLKTTLRMATETKLFEETGATLIAPIYDEITASVPKASAIEYIRRLMPLMAITPPGHAIPMVPEVSIGRNNWGYKVELGDNPTDDQILEAIYGKAEEMPVEEGFDYDEVFGGDEEVWEVAS